MRVTWRRPSLNWIVRSSARRRTTGSGSRLKPLSWRQKRRGLTPVTAGPESFHDRALFATRSLGCRPRRPLGFLRRPSRLRQQHPSATPNGRLAVTIHARAAAERNLRSVAAPGRLLGHLKSSPESMSEQPSLKARPRNDRNFWLLGEYVVQFANRY